MNKTSTSDVFEISMNSEDLFRFAEENFSDEPGQHVIDSLLRYSRSLEIRPSQLIGQIESIKN
jgi:hypothetical protein